MRSKLNRHVIVLGAGGQLGLCLQAIGAMDGTWLTRAQLDVTDGAAVDRFLATHPCDVLINCAAYTQVDQAQKEPEQAMLVNAQAVEHLALAAKRDGFVLIHISTDYVFNGQADSPYLEDAPPDPLNQYGISKWAGEKAIRAINPRALIIRTSWLYSPWRPNFFNTVQRLASQASSMRIVDDQWGTPTYAMDLAAALITLAQHPALSDLQATHCYHYSHQGESTWCRFAQAIVQALGLDVNVWAISSKEYPCAAVRPLYSVLDKSAIIHDWGLLIPDWQEGLRRCVQLKQGL